MTEVIPIESARRPDDRLWTIADIAEYLQVGQTTAYSVVASPSFPRSIRLGKGMRRWDQNEVKTWVRKQR